MSHTVKFFKNKLFQNNYMHKIHKKKHHKEFSRSLNIEVINF